MAIAYDEMILEHVLKALEPNPNHLRERLRHEQQDEPVEQYSMYDDATGIPKQGPI